jgi:uncharacterized membrane protein
MEYEQPPPTPNDLMRKLIAETHANGKTLTLIRRYIRSIEIMVGIWFLVSLPAVLAVALFWLFAFRH